MTAAEVEALVGLGQETTYEQIPEIQGRAVFAASNAREVSYRKWTQESGKSKTTLYAAFKDGKVIAGPLIFKFGPLTKTF